MDVPSSMYHLSPPSGGVQALPALLAGNHRQELELLAAQAGVALPRLAGCVSRGASIVRRMRARGFGGAGAGDADSRPDAIALADLLRSAMWAATNVIRGGGIEAGGDVDRLLTPEDATVLLLGPGPSLPPLPPSPPGTTSPPRRAGFCRT